MTSSTPGAPNLPLLSSTIPPDVLFYERTPWDADVQYQRASILAELLSPKDDQAPGRIIVTSAWALMPRSVPPQALKRALRTLQTGQRITMHELLTYLATSGYEFATVVDTPGTFSHRGSIIDVFSPQYERPLRVDFWGDEIDTLQIGRAHV